MWLWIFSRTLTLVRQCLQVTLEEGCTKKNWSNVKPYIQPQRTQYIRTVTGHWPNVIFRWPIAIPSSLLCSLKPVCFLGATNHTENDFCRALYCEMRYINVRYLQYNTICQPIWSIHNFIFSASAFMGRAGNKNIRSTHF